MSRKRRIRAAIGRRLAPAASPASAHFPPSGTGLRGYATP
ncbi:hypothetical protein M2175_000120 [Bradyrhizobium elkanii]|nr:hypothetical protein [Bradyrhizobium elkanii]MCS3974718.1 hypothetical protein [Bradyrhizobium japonicum]